MKNDSTQPNVKVCAAINSKCLGDGCILAHCMGLGKTLTVIVLINTIVKCKQLNINRILILCPKIVILNWKDEFNKWLGEDLGISLFWFNDSSSFESKLDTITGWSKSSAGVLLLNYESYRILISRSSEENEKSKVKEVLKCLWKEPDLAIFDDGHVIKRQDNNMYMQLNRIETRKRVILTGTPI